MLLEKGKKFWSWERIQSASYIIYAIDITKHASATTCNIKKTKKSVPSVVSRIERPCMVETRVFDILRTYFLTYREELFADIVARFIGARRGTIREMLTHSTTKSRSDY